MAACGGNQRPIELAHAFDRADVRQATAWTLFPGTSRSTDAEGEWLRVELGVHRGGIAIEDVGVAGLHRAPVPALELLRERAPLSRAPRLVVEGGAPWTFVEEVELAAASGSPSFAPGTFAAVGHDLWLARGDANDLPIALELPLPSGAREAGAWKVAFGPLTGHGIELWPGESWSVRIPRGGERRFEFLVVAEAFDPRSRHGEPLVYEITSPRSMSSLVTVADDDFAFEPCSVRVGPSSGELRITVTGRAARIAFLSPRIVPHDVQRREAPDAAIFLADTFRADLVGMQTAAGSLTPYLDAFARRGARFTEARSPSSWTLPAHVSMFTSLQPAAHGAIGYKDRVTPTDPSLPERLRDLGYRTVALTNGGFVARSYGMDRGFELFFEERGGNDVERLLERLETVLAHPDERPLFLFFHTYRAHDPYRVEEATMRRLGGALGVERDWDALIARLGERGFRWNAGDSAPEGSQRELTELEALYRAGAADVDQAFGRFTSMLAAHRRDDVVLFTSDHGEAFGARDGKLGHRLGPWEDQFRVPFVVRGRDVPPSIVRSPATLMDVPRTICALLDVAPVATWEGEVLVGPHARPRPVGAAFELHSAPDEVAAYAGTRKVVALGANLDTRRVFDLADDPWETGSDAERHRAWAEAKVEEWLADPAWRVPRLRSRAVEWSAADRGRLGDLGYFGRDQDAEVPRGGDGL